MIAKSNFKLFFMTYSVILSAQSDESFDRQATEVLAKTIGNIKNIQLKHRTNFLEKQSELENFFYEQENLLEKIKTEVNQSMIEFEKKFDQLFDNN